MAITDLLPQADLEQRPRAQKGGALSTSASLNLSTSFQDIITYTAGGVGVGSGAWLNCGNAPCVGFTVAWTYSAGTVLTVQAWVSNDPALVIIHPGWVIRDQGSTATDGLIKAFPAQVQIPKGAISSGTGFDVGGGATSLYAPVVVSTEGYRYVKLQAKSDNASGSVISYAVAGTNL